MKIQTTVEMNNKLPIEKVKEIMDSWLLDRLAEIKNAKTDEELINIIENTYEDGFSDAFNCGDHINLGD